MSVHGHVRILMVAEKPSLAQSISKFLSNGKERSYKRILEVHEFEGTFRNMPAHFKMTSVIGHVYTLDFPRELQNWEKTDPVSLFPAKTIKHETNPKARVCEHLKKEAQGCHYLILWLDCDREGENICFEVMDNALRSMQRMQGQQQVFRAKFSAISSHEINNAMRNLSVPNENEAAAVDGRQELDLKVGVAFTRFQTRYFQGKYGNLNSALISYGPCQIPTLNFCVERHQEITEFESEPFWTLQLKLIKGGSEVVMEWERGRVFDQSIANMFKQKVTESSKKILIKNISENQVQKYRPNGLNTVEMLKVASSALNMGPHHAMQVAERLYIQGYISYPRTESSGYPPNFDFKAILQAQTKNATWGSYVQNILDSNFIKPKGGTDAGDHPPITPVKYASDSEVGGGDAWRLYEYVARHFLATVSPNALLNKIEVTGECSGEIFKVFGTQTIKQGFLAVMPWKVFDDDYIPNFIEGEMIQIKSIELKEGKTTAPGYLTEAELISKMEKNNIGTDASISVHINNISERNYVKIEAGRRVVPTELGITLIKGYELIDPELCKPQVRAHVEKQLDLVAKGQANKYLVVNHVLDEFLQKFKYFVTNILSMASLFEASFSPLSSSGRPFSKCGKCRRYMKYISLRPSRLYCNTCEEVYNLPQGGNIKLYNNILCPLDGFELILYALGGRDGKTFALCPYCYACPPFEGIRNIEALGKSGMPCSLCLHPTCPESVCNKSINTCPACENGNIVLDPVGAPRWRLDCNRCPFLIYLPEKLQSVKIATEQCQECNSLLIECHWKPENSPLEDNKQKYIGCVICDDDLRGMCEIKNGMTFVRRGGRNSNSGRGRSSRGKGRGRRGRRGGRGGRGKLNKPDYDPLMSFSDF